MNPTSEALASFESTYALLVRSEEKHRSRFETAVYSLLIASTVFAVSQFGREAVAMPPNISRVLAAEAGCSQRV